MKNSDSIRCVKRAISLPVCAVLLAGSLLSGAPSVCADEASDEFNLAVGLYRKQRFDLAAETFGGFLEQYPDHPRTNLARLYYGLSLNVLEQYEPARKQFSQFIADDPDSANIADARYRLAECSYYLKDYPAAVEQLQQYLTLHVGHVHNNWATLLLGDSFTAQQEWEKAQSTLKKLIAASPDPQLQADAGFSLARALDGGGRHDEAVALYRRLADDTTPEVAAEALTRQGVALFRQQQYRESAEAYDQIIERFAGSERAKSAALNSGMALFRLKDFDAAIERFRKVPTDSPYVTRAALMTGLSLQSLGRTDDAREELDRALSAAGDSEVAAEILFERAELERAAGQPAQAAQMYEDLADRWPEDQRVPDSLFSAAELHLDMNQLPTARRLLTRLESEPKAAGLQGRVQILEGRILLTEGKPQDAIEMLQPLVEQSAQVDARTTAIGRYYLLRAYHENGQHAEALNEMERLQPSLQQPEFGHLRGSLATAVISSLQLERFADVQKYADQFLASTESGRQTADVLAARAVASAHLQKFDLAAADVIMLSKQFPDRPQTWTAILQSADIALQTENNQAAAAFFEAAATRREDAQVREAGLSGLAWSEYRQELYDKAADTFGTLAEEFPNSHVAPQAAFMHANSLHDAGRSDEAITASLAVFVKLSEPAAAALDEAAVVKRRRFAFDSGQLAARLLSKAERIDEADQVWEQMATRFADSDSLEQILDEWAWLNLSNARYERSDEIYRRLVKDFPDSKFAGQARLSLAESEMAANRFDQAEREFQAIVATDSYGTVERQNALFHLIEIRAGDRDWARVREYGDQYLANYADSPHSPAARLLHADALLNLNEYDKAREELDSLHNAVLSGQVQAEEWTERLWVVMAELALASKRYNDIDPIAAEMESRFPKSRFLFQMYDVQGRRWKFQAEPNFVKAREYFQKVIQHPNGRGTETAARCQFQIAETLLLQSRLENNLQLARKEFLRVVTNYAHDEWRVQGLFQAAQCEEALKLNDAAILSYEELVKDFPNSEFVERARERLAILKQTSS